MNRQAPMLGCHVRRPWWSSVTELAFAVEAGNFRFQKTLSLLKRYDQLWKKNWLMWISWLNFALLFVVLVVATVISVLGFLFELLCFCFCLCGRFFVLPSRHHRQVLGGFLPLEKPINPSVFLRHLWMFPSKCETCCFNSFHWICKGHVLDRWVLGALLHDLQQVSFTCQTFAM